MKENSSTASLNSESLETRNIESAFEAIYNYDNDSIQTILHLGLNPNAINKKGEPILHAAIKTLNIDLIQVLLNIGADPNLPTPVPQQANLSNVNYLFNKDKIELFGATPLITALNMGIIPEYKSPMLESIQEITSILLEHGAKVNKSEENLGLTPLHFAASTCEPELLALLLQNGADVNAKAFKKQFYDSENPENMIVTPLLLAGISDNNPKFSPDCIDLLMKNGSSIEDYSHMPVFYSIIISELNEASPEKARDIMLKKLNSDFEKMKPERIEKIVEHFLSSNPQYTSQYENCVRTLLDRNTCFNNKMDQIRYFSHLNSWEGVVSGSFYTEKNLPTLQKDNAHYVEEVEGWITSKQVPGKIVNFLYILKGIQNPDFNCLEKFGEPREQIFKKIMDEIYAQVTTYFSYQHLNYVSYLSNTPSLLNKNRDEFAMPRWYFKPEVDLKRSFETALVNKWAERIAQLKPGQYFAMYFGTIGHATYADYRMQENGKLTWKAYNLGAGNELHPMSLERKIYPYTIVDIPVEPFQTKSFEALSHLYTFLTAKNNKSMDKHNNIHPAFQNAYESAFSLGGNPPASLDGFIPMKEQVVGNCSVKNNNFAMRNRLQNDRLYKFIKNYEILSLKHQLNIDDKLIYAKEISKDIQNLDNAFSGTLHPIVLEKELFRFFSKRSAPIQEETVKKPGDRIAEAITNAKDPAMINEYFAESPKIFWALEKIASHFNSDMLRTILEKYSTSYEIHNQSLKNTQIRRNLFQRFPHIPSSGRTGIFEKDSATPSEDHMEVESSVTEINVSNKKRKADDLSLQDELRPSKVGNSMNLSFY